VVLLGVSWLRNLWFDSWLDEFSEISISSFFGFLVCYAATQLANQLQQTRIQVVCSNKVARKSLTESNGTPAMDLVHIDVVLKEYYFYVLFQDCCFEVHIFFFEAATQLARQVHQERTNSVCGSFA